MSKFSDLAGKAGKIFKVINTAQAGANLHKDLPLAYCLMLDPRAPLGPKAWFGTKFAFMVVDAPIPLMGQVDALIAVQACQSFVKSCERINPALVAEHRVALDSRTSTWDLHIATGSDTAKKFGQTVGDATTPAKDVVKRVAVPVTDVAKRTIDRLRGRGGLN